VALLNDRANVEDVVHDVFVSFAQNAGDFQLSGSLKGYLSICVANRARDKNRALLRQATLDPDETGRVGSVTTRPDDPVMQSELSSRLDYALSQLPYEQREAIVLHIQSRMGFRQIARLKAVSVNTVMSRYRYGIEKLRSILDGELKIWALHKT
jgi:RNA polymerase sigma-70 factor (ECF subfamily)